MTAVELDPEIAKIYQSYFPDDKMVVGDAHQYLLDHLKSFDFIWASPPCPTHTRININFNIVRYADMKLYQEIILLEAHFNGKYCIENVIPYNTPLIPAQQADRHLFWCNFKIRQTDKRNPKKQLKMIPQKTKKRIDKMKRWHNDGVLLNTGPKDEKYGFTLNGFKSKMNHKEKVLNNLVNPETGLMILNCARNIITKSNVNQLDIFEK